MPAHNSYLAYKRDTNHLIYWIIHASNSVIRSVPIQDEDAPITPNTTAQTTAAGLLSLSKLIAKHINPIPSTIYRLFESVIGARSAAHQAFQTIVVQKPDPEIEKSNASHKHFIDILNEAFKALGGEAWKLGLRTHPKATDNEEDRETVVFANKFDLLNINGAEDEEESEEEAQVGAPQRRQQKRGPGKSKKGKRGKKGKKNLQKHTAVKEPLDDLPLESFRIIESETPIMTDYLVAVYALAQEWVSLRSCLQKIWHDVAYDGLNGAVAGAMSNVAIATIKQMEAEIFVDFPGNDSFETVMNTITRGNPDSAQTRFSLNLWKTAPGEKAEKVKETFLDIKEQIMVHTYQHLLDFIVDFQKTRSGKPTKSMVTQIKNWDPKFNLQKATKDERIKWRRSYTINWLYDMVHLYSMIVVEGNTREGESTSPYEDVNWSMQGRWAYYRRFFGLSEFAGVVTSLAMQKPGTDVRKKILPHHVFELQCIIDSLMVSRGWTVNTLMGHVLESPAAKFRPGRHCEQFLGLKDGISDIDGGYLGMVDILIKAIAVDAERHEQNPARYEKYRTLLEHYQANFGCCLGQSDLVYNQTTVHPSRFADTDPNGLWEYSPYLCGVGLMESLDVAYLQGMLMWDDLPESIWVIHLHNMLVQRGYIKEPIGLWWTIQNLWPTNYFCHGRLPTSGFGDTMLCRIGKTQSAREAYKRRYSGNNTVPSEIDPYGVLSMKRNAFFKVPNQTVLYRAAGWNPERIPDADIVPNTLLGALRVSQRKVVIDPKTGERRLEDTELVRRARAAGIGDEEFLMMSRMFDAMKGVGEPPVETPAEIRKENEGYKEMNLVAKPNDRPLSGSELIETLKLDIWTQVCGNRPISGLNFLEVTATILVLFQKIEVELKRLRNPVYMEAYKDGLATGEEKRFGLVLLALNTPDRQCLEVMAKIFESLRADFADYVYWDDLESTKGKNRWTRKKDRDELPDVGGRCGVM